jgi:hypothetical protein
MFEKHNRLCWNPISVDFLRACNTDLSKLDRRLSEPEYCRLQPIFVGYFNHDEPIEFPLPDFFHLGEQEVTSCGTNAFWPHYKGLGGRFFPDENDPGVCEIFKAGSALDRNL